LPIIAKLYSQQSIFICGLQKPILYEIALPPLSAIKKTGKSLSPDIKQTLIKANLGELP
jgi:hypothetical protein